MNNATKAAAYSIGGAIALVVVAFFISYSILITGFTLSVLWGWFAVPILHLPPLTLAQAIGVMLVAGYLTHQMPSKDTHSARYMMFFIPFRAALLLLIGYAVKFFI